MFATDKIIPSVVDEEQAYLFFCQFCLSLQQQCFRNQQEDIGNALDYSPHVTVQTCSKYSVSIKYLQMQVQGRQQVRELEGNTFLQVTRPENGSKEVTVLMVKFVMLSFILIYLPKDCKNMVK